MQTGTPPILLIYGPTASAKSALALFLAQKLGGEIINADSMQVYRPMPVLTAQPDKHDRALVPHHLYGCRDPEEPGSVGWWLGEALNCIRDIEARGKWPILVGGTGLYLQALSQGLADIPAIEAPARKETKEILQNRGMAGLRETLHKLDPLAASRIHGADRQRLVRAVEVCLQTGQALSALQARTRPALAPGSWQGLVLMPPKERLHENIARRFEQMLQEGALEEARTMAQLDLGDHLPATKALGLAPLIGHINDQISLDAARELALRDTRRYAKRQRTWARGRFAHWPVIAASRHDEREQEALRLIRQHRPQPDEAGECT